MIVLLGPSGSGKTTLEKKMHDMNYRKVVSYTTRPPREGEINGFDYQFVTDAEFNWMISDDKFAEWDCYSQNRKYGTLKTEYDVNYRDQNEGVVVLTPNGFRALQKNGIKVTSVLLQANLGTRMIRYIERCGVDKFTFDDKNEISARVERDYGMFLGVEKEVDIVLDTTIQGPRETLYNLCKKITKLQGGK